MAMYLGSKKVAVTNTVEKQVPSMKAFFEAGGKCSQSKATSFDGCWQYDDTANVTNMSYMFYSCTDLITIPQLDTSKVTNMNSMFAYCYKLTTVPLLDTSNVTDMSYMFQNCSNNLTTIPQLDTSKVTNMESMFNYCKALTTIPQLDTSNVTSMWGIFNSCSNLEVIHMVNINASLDIHYSNNFTREALLEIIGNLKQQTSGSKKLTMGATNLAKLTDEDKKIATDKGWTLA